MKEVIAKLFESKPLTLIVCGALFVLLGASGGIPKLGVRIEEDVWRSFLAIWGTLLLLAGVMVVVREITRPVRTDNVQKYGIRILLPGENDVVSNPIEVSGTYEVKPPENLIRLLEYSPTAGLYWAKAYITFDEKARRWYGQIEIGGHPDEKRSIVVAAVGPDGRALLEYSKKIGVETKTWHGIEALTNDIVPCDRVMVRRGRDKVLASPAVQDGR